MGKWFLCAALSLASVSISASFLSAADDTAAPTTQPAAKPARAKKLTKPWSMLTTLSPEQTASIEKIHADALEERKKIDAKEKDDIMALLTPDQVKELAADEAAAKKATTKPAK
jgi:Spy/CpxP family protein refolding chaperone